MLSEAEYDQQPHDQEERDDQQQYEGQQQDGQTEASQDTAEAHAMDQLVEEPAEPMLAFAEVPDMGEATNGETDGEERWA